MLLNICPALSFPRRKPITSGGHAGPSTSPSTSIFIAKPSKRPATCLRVDLKQVFGEASELKRGTDSQPFGWVRFCPVVRCPNELTTSQESCREAAESLPSHLSFAGQQERTIDNAISLVRAPDPLELLRFLIAEKVKNRHVVGTHLTTRRVRTLIRLAIRERFEAVRRKYCEASRGSSSTQTPSSSDRTFFMYFIYKIEVTNRLSEDDEEPGDDNDEFELPYTPSPVPEVSPRTSPRISQRLTSRFVQSPQRNPPLSAGEDEVKRFLDSIVPSMAWLLDDLLTFGFTEGSYIFGAAQQTSDTLQRTLQRLQASIASRKRRQMTPLQEELLRSAIEGYNWTSDPAVYAHASS
jgi:hypothetical protein